MEKIAHLSLSKYTRKYNDTLQKKLAAANIKVTKQSTKYGYGLYVSSEDYSRASVIVLSIPFRKSC
jgi:hypothetical protein